MKALDYVEEERTEANKNEITHAAVKEKSRHE